MRHVARFAITLACLALAAPYAMAAGPLYIAPEMGVAPGTDVTHRLDGCPFRAEFSTTLSHALEDDGVSFTTKPLPRPTGRSLKVELTDLGVSGNGFIGHHQYIRMRGTLYQDGKKVAAFTSRAMYQDEGMNTACRSLRMSMRAQAYYVSKWVEHPVDGAVIKPWGQ